MFKKFKKPSDLGTCQFCGEPLKEFFKGWGCSNQSCGAVVFKENKFFDDFLGVKCTKNTAIKLLMGDAVYYYGLEIKGVKHDVKLTLEPDNRGSYKYRFNAQFIDKKDDKKKNSEPTGFDILNED